MPDRKREIWSALSLTVSAATIAFLPACGGGSHPSVELLSSIPTTVESDGAAAVNTVEITAWDEPPDDDANKPEWEKEMDDFSAKFPNIKVKHEKVDPTKYREQYLTAMAGGVGPDVWSGNAFPDIQKYILNGFVADLTNRWNEYADKEQFSNAAIDAGTRNGRLYGFPRDIYVMTMVYNKKLFKAAGISAAPRTWDEFVRIAQRLTDPATGQYGFNILGTEWADWYFEYFVWQAGGDLTRRNDDGTATLTFDSDAAVKALQFYKDLKWTHKIVQKNALQDWDRNLQDFAAGKAGMEIGSVDMFTGKGMNIGDIGLMPFPAGPSGKAYGQVGGALWTINAHSSKEKQDAAWTYITYVSSKEQKEKELQWVKDRGGFPNLFQVRKDIAVSAMFPDIRQDLVDAVLQTAANPHQEYFLKDRLSKYVVAAIQQILMNEKADPRTELQKQQLLAKREVIDSFNEDIRSGK